MANSVPDKASNPKRKVTKKESWSCNTCGATTTNPDHMLIQYFHENCPGRNK